MKFVRWIYILLLSLLLLAGTIQCSGPRAQVVRETVPEGTPAVEPPKELSEIQSEPAKEAPPAEPPQAPLAPQKGESLAERLNRVPEPPRPVPPQGRPPLPAPAASPGRSRAAPRARGAASARTRPGGEGVEVRFELRQRGHLRGHPGHGRDDERELHRGPQGQRGGQHPHHGTDFHPGYFPHLSGHSQHERGDGRQKRHHLRDRSLRGGEETAHRPEHVQGRGKRPGGGKVHHSDPRPQVYSRGRGLQDDQALPERRGGHRGAPLPQHRDRRRPLLQRLQGDGHHPALRRGRLRRHARPDLPGPERGCDRRGQGDGANLLLPRGIGEIREGSGDHVHPRDPDQLPPGGELHSGRV